MKSECTQSLREYRDLLRVIWNDYFLSRPIVRDPDAHVLFNDAAARLFEALIYLPLGIYVPVTDRYQPGLSGDFIVEIAVSEANLAVNARPQSVPGKIYGKPTLPVRPGEAELRFVAFFDWNEFGQREFALLRVQIAKFESHPELVGRHALVEMSACTIWLDYTIVEKGVENSPPPP
jgi:hypothetical protein